MLNRLKKQDKAPEPVATNPAGPRDFNDFNLGSLESRAAARAALEARTAELEEGQGFCLLMDAGAPEFPPHVVTEILSELREAGRLPKGPSALVDLTSDSSVWKWLDEAKRERLLREHGIKS